MAGNKLAQIIFEAVALADDYIVGEADDETSHTFVTIDNSVEQPALGAGNGREVAHGERILLEQKVLCHHSQL